MQMQKRVETLIEQTDFLLEKQKEALRSTEDLFTGFVKIVQAKTKQAGLGQADLKSLTNISNMLAEKLSDITEDMQGDIDFLEKQLETLKVVATTKDAAKAQTMLDMVIERDEELLETEEFKSTITEDTEIAKQDLVAVIDDLTEALNEGNIRDVELLLEAMGSEGEIEIEFENDELDEDEDECDSCEDSCCNSNKKGVDIFKGCCKSDDADGCCGSKKKRK